MIIKIKSAPFISSFTPKLPFFLVLILPDCFLSLPFFAFSIPVHVPFLSQEESLHRCILDGLPCKIHNNELDWIDEAIRFLYFLYLSVSVTFRMTLLSSSTTTTTSNFKNQKQDEKEEKYVEQYETLKKPGGVFSFYEKFC